MEGLTTFGLKPKHSLPRSDQLVFEAWHMMRGLDWAALPTVMALLGVEDPEWFVASLLAVRGHFDQQADD